jgi:hypothetical protein
MTNKLPNKVVNLVAFAVLGLLWLAFGAAALLNPEMLDDIWQSFQNWPPVFQLIVGLLVLPVALGLWIWETSWPFFLRFILVVGLAYVTVYLFFPRWVFAKAEASQTQP